MPRDTVLQQRAFDVLAAFTKASERALGTVSHPDGLQQRAPRRTIRALSQSSSCCAQSTARPEAKACTVAPVKFGKPLLNNVMTFYHV